METIAQESDQKTEMSNSNGNLIDPSSINSSSNYSTSYYWASMLNMMQQQQNQERYSNHNNNNTVMEQSNSAANLAATASPSSSSVIHEQQSAANVNDGGVVVDPVWNQEFLTGSIEGKSSVISDVDGLQELLYPRSVRELLAADLSWTDNVNNVNSLLQQVDGHLVGGGGQPTDLMSSGAACNLPFGHDVDRLSTSSCSATSTLSDTTSCAAPQPPSCPWPPATTSHCEPAHPHMPPRTCGALVKQEYVDNNNSISNSNNNNIRIHNTSSDLNNSNNNNYPNVSMAAADPNSTSAPAGFFLQQRTVVGPSAGTASQPPTWHGGCSAPLLNFNSSVNQNNNYNTNNNNLQHQRHLMTQRHLAGYFQQDHNILFGANTSALHQNNSTYGGLHAGLSSVDLHRPIHIHCSAAPAQLQYQYAAGPAFNNDSSAAAVGSQINQHALKARLFQAGSQVDDCRKEIVPPDQKTNIIPGIAVPVAGDNVIKQQQQQQQHQLSQEELIIINANKRSRVDHHQQQQQQQHQQQQLVTTTSTTAVAPSSNNLSTKSQPPRKEKLGERITTLQQLVSPFGKTDTASVLLEAIGYIKFLQQQVQALSSPYFQSTCNTNTQNGASEQRTEDSKHDLRSRGLCLVPLSCCTMHMANDNGADYWFNGALR